MEKNLISGLMSGRNAAGMRHAFDALYLQNRRRIYSLAYHALQNRADAEDVTQEVFARAWANFSTYTPDRPFEAWIYRIARNLSIDYARRRKYRRHLSLDASEGETGQEYAGEIADSTYDPTTCLLEKQLSEPLQHALMALSWEYRTALLLLQAEYTYQQIAEAMGCPVGTVRSRIYRARLIVRNTIDA